MLTQDALSYSPSNRILTCVSTGGPATTVTWRKDDDLIPLNSSTYTQSQVVMDTITATYHNLLSINSSDPRDTSGTFSCNVSNTRGNSMELSVLT